MAANLPENDPFFEDTICDKCGCEMPSNEAVDGPEGTEWQGKCICAHCLAEVLQ